MTMLSIPAGRIGRRARRTIAVGVAALAIAGGPVGPLQAAPAQDGLGPEMRDRWYLDGGAALVAVAPVVADRWYLDAPMDLAARAVEPAPAARDRWYLD